MRGHHYVIIFASIVVILMLLSDNKFKEQITITENNQEMDTYFDNAVDAGTKQLITVNENQLELNKQEAVNSFLNSMYASLGIMGSFQSQERLQAYLPVMAITDNDGFYIYYGNEYQENGHLEIKKLWSEKIPYTYEDQDFIYRFCLDDTVTLYDKKNLIKNKENRVIRMNYHEAQTEDLFLPLRNENPQNIMLDNEIYELKKRECIISEIEKTLEYYINQYNEIAQHYGITYTFTMPVIDESEWVRSIDEVALIVIFQGYPYQGINVTYNRFSIAGAQISKKNAYYLEKKNYYYVYHRLGCTDFTPDQDTIICYTKEDCAKFGAYACQKCNPNSGIYNPIKN